MFEKGIIVREKKMNEIHISKNLEG